MFRAIHCSLIAAGLVLVSHAALAENRIALVIGQSNYRAVVALPNPANDAKAMSQLLGEAGFEVERAADLSQNEMREKVSDFAAKVAAKGPDTVALVFYAGHGLQIDGENYLVPVDVDPKREADIPLQAVRLNDVLNTLTSVPSKMRILLLDACRNNPFPEINKTAGHGLAILDAKTGAPGTFMSFSTSPGAEAEDGSGTDSPYTTALLSAAKQPGLSIEDAFKRVRVAVNKTTDGRQTPWDSSSLTDEFSFFPNANSNASATTVAATGTAVPKPPATRRTVAQWRTELQDKRAEAANEMVVADGSEEGYEAFVGLFAASPFGAQARQWLDRHRRMVAWNNAVIINTAASYHAFLAQYPDSDLTATAQKLQQRLLHRPDLPNALALAVPIGASVGPTCPCTTQPPLLKKADLAPNPKKKIVEPDPPKRSSKPRRVRNRDDGDDVPVYHRPPPVYDEPAYGPPIGIGIGIGGFGGGGGFHGGGGERRGRY
jgi:Caspase domain